MTLARVHEIAEVWPDLRWPYKTESTRRLIRLGRLGCVRVGSSIFVTRPLLEEFIARHIVPAKGEG